MKRNFIIGFLFVITTCFSQDLSTDLLLDYAFNNNADDSSGNGYHGTLLGVTFVDDRFGNPNAAAYFDGIDDYIELPNLTDLKPNLPLSFSFWIKYDSTSSFDRAVFNTSYEDDRSSGVYFNTQISTGRYAINYGDGTYAYISSARRSYVSSQVIDITSWHHVVAVIESGTNMDIYVDCNNQGGTYSGTGGPLVYSSTPGNIGRNDRNLGVPAEYFKGAIDDFRYWSRALTPDEVSNLCNEGLSIDEFTKSTLLRIYPNPTKDIFKVKSAQQIETFSLFDMNGKLLQQGAKANDNRELLIDINGYRKGIYVLNVTTTTGNYIKKIIKE